MFKELLGLFTVHYKLERKYSPHFVFYPGLLCVSLQGLTTKNRVNLVKIIRLTKVRSSALRRFANHTRSENTKFDATSLDITWCREKASGLVTVGLGSPWFSNVRFG